MVIDPFGGDYFSCEYSSNILAFVFSRIQHLSLILWSAERSELNTAEGEPPSLPPEFRIPRGSDTPGSACHSENALSDFFGGWGRCKVPQSDGMPHPLNSGEKNY